MNMDYIGVACGLVLLSLWLTNYQPPLKKQWVALILMLVGCIVGHFILNNWGYGFLISGLVYYKDALAVEIASVLESFKAIREDVGGV